MGYVICFLASTRQCLGESATRWTKTCDPTSIYPSIHLYHVAIRSTEWFATSGEWQEASNDEVPDVKLQLVAVGLATLCSIHPCVCMP